MLGRTSLVAALLGSASVVAAPPPPVVVGGASPTTYAVAPTVQYHPNSQSATLNGSNQVLDCADLKGLAPLLGLAAVSGNKFRNPIMAGAVAGSPGTMPTNWGTSPLGTLSFSVVSASVRNGMQYLTFRVFGTTSTTALNIMPEISATNIAAANGQTWTFSNFMAITAGSTANISSILQRSSIRDAAGNYLGELVDTPADVKSALTGVLTRQTATTGTISNASAAFLRPWINITFASGAAIDITLSIALPVIEQTASASAITTVGPVQMTDALGRKFWRFSANQYLLITNALASINSRSCAVFAVWRQHRVSRGMDQPLFSTRYSAYTDDTTNTARTNGYILRTQSNTGAGTSDTPKLKSGTTTSLVGHANSFKMVPGSQLHVTGFVSRSGASAGTDVGGRFYTNTDAVPTAQSSLTGTADVGAIIGGRATGTNGVTGFSDNAFDLYELAFWKGTLTDAQGDAIAAAMVANWNIPTITGQIILLGDSITYGTVGSGSDLVPSDTIGVQITQPGAEMVPTNFAVINAAIPDSSLVTYAGQTGCLLTDQRDNAAGPLTGVYPGGAANNIIAVNIGINDMKSGNGNVAAATHYANFVALLNTTTTGYLQRGFKVVAVTPTAVSGDSTGQSRILAFRDLLINPSTDGIVSQFLTDTLSNTGQAYDGLVSVLPICKITSGASGTVFQTAADAADTTNYATDGTHLRGVASRLLASGGDTPQYGYGAIA